jgi:hypothetical protein
MRHVVRGIMLAAVLVLGAHTAAVGDPPDAPLKKCPVDAVVSGTACMDTYEASVWRVPNATPTNKGLVVARTTRLVSNPTNSAQEMKAQKKSPPR